MRVPLRAPGGGAPSGGLFALLQTRSAEIALGALWVPPQRGSRKGGPVASRRRTLEIRGRLPPKNLRVRGAS